VITHKPYPDYKESGVDWLGAVPTAWDIHRVGDIAVLMNGFPFDASLFGHEGVPLIRIRDLNKAQTESRFAGTVVPAAMVAPGEVLVGMDGDFNVGRWLGEEGALLNQRMLAIRGENTRVRLIEYALLTPLSEINRLTYSTTVKHLASAQVRAIRVAIPRAAAERRQLLEFLDRETAEIDAFIADQEELIALLGERRVAIIGNSLDSAWTHERWPLKRLYSPRRVPDAAESAVLSVYRDHGVVLKDSRSDNFNKTPEDTSRYLQVRPGDLAINRMKAWQGSLGVSELRGKVSGDYEVVAPLSANPLAGRFAHVLLRSSRLVGEYRLRSTGIRPSQWRLYWGEMGDIRVPVPPENEQLAIVEHIDHETAEINAAIADAREAIALSKERRAALISAAVTGKIDVRSEGAD